MSHWCVLALKPNARNENGINININSQRSPRWLEQRRLRSRSRTEVHGLDPQLHFRMQLQHRLHREHNPTDAEAIEQTPSPTDSRTAKIHASNIRRNGPSSVRLDSRHDWPQSQFQASRFAL